MKTLSLLSTLLTVAAAVTVKVQPTASELQSFGSVSWDGTLGNVGFFEDFPGSEVAEFDVDNSEFFLASDSTKQLYLNPTGGSPPYKAEIGAITEPLSTRVTEFSVWTTDGVNTHLAFTGADGFTSDFTACTFGDGNYTLYGGAFESSNCVVTGLLVVSA